MEQFVNLTVSGVVTGAIISLIAAGLIVTYTATGIFNFSYGAIAYCSGFLYYELHTGLGWPVAPAALVTIAVFAPLLGAALNAAVFRPLGRSTDATKIMATIGLLLALPAAARFLVGRGIALFDWRIPSGVLIQSQSGIWHTPPKVWHLGGVRVSSNDVVMLAITAVAAAALYVLLQRTRLGLSMRAVVDRPDLAGLRGISERRTSYAAWVTGSVLAATAGVAGAPYFGPLVPGRYTQFMLIAATAAVAARLTSLPIGLLAGLGIGVIKNYVATYAGFASGVQGFENSVPFVIMFIGLILLGRDRGRRAGIAAIATPPPQHASDLPPWRRRLPWLIALLVLVAMIGFVLDGFWLNTIAYGAGLSIVFLSFVLVTGLGGMVSLAQATFVTTGALVAGMAVGRFGVPFLVALLIGAAAAVALGAIAALPSLRLGGLALALATLALALVGESVLFQWNWLRNGQSGWALRPPSLGPIDLRDPRTMAFFMFAVLGVAAVLVRNVQRSSLGRAVLAVRDSQVAAAAAGISVVRAKLAIFCLSAGFAGVAGVLLATHQGNVTNRTFPAELGLLWLAIAVLFGIRRIGGAVIAGLVAATTVVWFRSGWELPGVFPSFLDWGGAGDTWSDISAMLFGLGAIQLARNPHGVLDIVGAQNRARRDRRRARRREVERRATPQPATPLAGAIAASAPDPDSALVLAGVRSGYGPVTVLHDVTLEVRAGAVTALVGPNGAGKSTLCLTAAGALPVTSGSVRAGGEDFTAASPAQRARAGVVLAPEGRGVFPGLSVDDNLAVWLPAHDDRDAVYERFPVLHQRRDLPAGSLSGGEQQMLTLAPLLQRPPAVLLADEPSLGLAPRVFADLRTLFTELRDGGVALLLVEEKATRVLDIADTVAVLQLGRVAWSGAPADLGSDQLAELYLKAEAVAPEAAQ